MSERTQALFDRAQDACELCGASEALAAYAVPSQDATRENQLLACQTCRTQLPEGAPLDAGRWHGLHGSIWSEHAPVQVMSWRLLKRLPHESWARDLLEQAYLDDETLAWAEEGQEQDRDDVAPTYDSHGAPLEDGDAVTLTRDLDVKGTSFTAKRGTLVKGIRLTDDPAYIEGRVNKIAIMLKTQFLKKA